MAKSTGTYILLAGLAIPAATFVTLLIISQFVVNWYDLILPVFVVYTCSFFASIIVRRACGKKTGNWRKALGWLFIKTGLFTFGVMSSVCYAVSGGEPLISATVLHTTINNVYLITLIVAWGIMAAVNEYTFK